MDNPLHELQLWLTTEERRLIDSLLEMAKDRRTEYRRQLAGIKPGECGESPGKVAGDAPEGAAGE